MKSKIEDPAELSRRLLGDRNLEACPFGAGKFSDVFEVTDRDNGQRYVLRVAPEDSLLQLFYEYRMMRQEPRIHERLRKTTHVPVPEILGHDFTREHIQRDYLVMPRLPGVPLSEAQLSGAAGARVHREWAGYVRQIHDVHDETERFGYLGEHHCMEPEQTWRAAFRTMYHKLLDDIVACGVYDAGTADMARELLEGHLGVFEACITSHLCHGDLWVTNVLVAEDGEVTGVLDFDRACWGDLEWDLAIAEYCGVTNSAFWEGYGRVVDTHSGDAAVRRQFYLLYEHQKYIVISISARRNDPGRARRYAEESLQMMEPLRAV